VNNRRSWRSPLKPFAGVGVAYSRREQAEAEDQHEDVQHEMLLAALFSVRHFCVLPGRRVAMDQLIGFPACPFRISGREVPLGA